MKSKIKVYVDNWVDVKKLESHNIEIIWFSFENTNKRIKNKWIASWNLEYFWNAPLRDFTSPLKLYNWKTKFYNWIEKIVWKQNKTDVLHLDSAIKSWASFFITNDKDDIFNKKDELENLLWIKILYQNNLQELFDEVYYLWTEQNKSSFI